MNRRNLSRLPSLILAVAAPLFFTSAGQGATGSGAASGHPAFEVVALGTGGPGATGRASSGFILNVNGNARVLVDAGGGTFARVSELKIALDDLDLVLLTHLHIDHCADVPAIFKARGIAHRGPYEFQVFGPSGAGPYPSVSRWLNLLFEPGGVFAYQPDFNGKETIKPTNLTSDLAKPPAVIYDAAGIKVTAVATHHGDCPSVAYRVEHDGRSVTFSGDMDASAIPNITKLAAKSDLLVFNCVARDAPGSPEGLYELHSPPKVIGMAAHDAGVKRLLLSHLGPDIEEHIAEVRKSISQSYKGSVTMAEDKAKYRIGP